MANASNSITFQLPNGVTASTYVWVVGGAPVPFVTFTSAAGKFGEITLGPYHNYISEDFYVGLQRLSIYKLYYAPVDSASPGQVFVGDGVVTDVNGENPINFSGPIASYPQAPWPTS